MKHLAAFCVYLAIIFFCLSFSHARAAEIEVAPGIKVTDPSNTGAAVLRVPIDVPPGRGGVAPNIALSYNSGSGNGWVGMGWNLEAGAIQRSTKNGVNYSSNDFIFLKDDASQELVLRGDWGTNYYGAKIEGAFTKFYYNSSTGGWEATTKDGLKYYYGSATASRQNNPWNNANNSQVLKWFLDKVQDLNGNYMTLSYVVDQGVTYLCRIDYTGNSGGLGPTENMQFSRNGSLLSKIDVYAGTQLVRSVGLSYTTSADTGRSLLSSITRYGNDGSSALPAITFSYQSSEGGFTAAVSGPAVGNNIAAGDFTGDGRADIADVSTVTLNNSTSVYYSQGNGFSQPATLNTPVPTCIVYLGYIPTNTMTITNVVGRDFNGDGALDLIINGSSPSCGGFSYLFYAGYSNGQLSFSPSTSLSLAGIAGDFNGDGITDYANSAQWPMLSSMTVALSKTDGTRTSAAWPVSPAVDWCPYTATGDFNGDGKADMLFYGCADGYAKVLFSTGSSFVVAGVANNFNSANVVVGDFDGDGRADIAMVSGSVTYIYFAKDGFSSHESWSTPLPSATYGIAINKLLSADFNGDGKADLLIAFCYNDGYGHCINSASRVYYSTGPIPDLLSTATNGLGGVTTIGYRPSTDYDNIFLPVVAQVVSSISVDDGNGNLAATAYTYAGGLFDDREFRGFSYVKATAFSGTTTEIWYEQDDIYKGLPTLLIISDAQGNVYSGAANTYQQSSPYTGVSFRFLSVRDDYLVDGSLTRQDVDDGAWLSKPYKKTSAEFYYDAYGNITHTHYDGDVAVSGDERDEWVEYTYQYPSQYSSLTGKWVVALPYTNYVKDQSGAIAAQTWFDYDTANGNLLTKTAWLSTISSPPASAPAKTNSANPITQYRYYGNGNLWYVTDAKGYTTWIDEYDPTGTYPTTIRNSLGNVTRKTYDARFGRPLTETDPNNGTVYYTYDLFGRIKTITMPEDNAVAAYAWKQTSYDGLGRVIASKTLGPNNKLIGSEAKYNGMGQLEQTSLPYFTDSQGNVLESRRWTRYFYDPLSRITDIQASDDTVVSKDYARGRTTLTDANGHQKIEERDAYGRLTKVEEYAGDEAHSNFALYSMTTYTYDVLSNLLNVTDTKGNVTTMTYNTLSGKTSMNDPDMGYWQYDYDKNGNLTWQKDAVNQIIQFQYDVLNRITRKDYPTGTDAVYTYDEIWSSNSKGRLTTVTDASGSERYYYDPLGRVATLIKTIDGINYQINTAYDQIGRTASIQYSDGETVRYGYDAGGNLNGVSNYASFSSFNALGQAGRTSYANGVTTTRQYYSTNNRLYSITTNGLQGGLQNLSYNYDNTGNIGMITDVLDSSKTQTFQYDHLDRLISAASSSYIAGLGTNTLSYQYNEIGNIMTNSKMGPGQWKYWKDVYGTKPHAVCNTNNSATCAYAYDANGNMVSKGGMAIHYNSDNLPDSINGSVFVYDYNGRRVKKDSTVYIGKLYECTGGVCTKHVFADGQRIASQTPSKTYFFHPDHLGGSNIVTNETGYKVEQAYYYPFGERRAYTGDVTKYKFTGQEFDTETGLYNYNARLYAPELGRFISADPIVQDYADPQSLNRYTYVYNSPINAIDPSGLDTLSVGSTVSGGAFGYNIGGGLYFNVGHDPSKSLWTGWSLSVAGTAGGGAQAGQGASVQGNVMHTNAKDVSQFTGTFWVTGSSYSKGNRVYGVDKVFGNDGVTGSNWYFGQGYKSPYATPASIYAEGTTTSAIFQISSNGKISIGDTGKESIWTWQPTTVQPLAVPALSGIDNSFNNYNSYNNYDAYMPSVAFNMNGYLPFLPAQANPNIDYNCSNHYCIPLAPVNLNNYLPNMLGNNLNWPARDVVVEIVGFSD